MVIQDAREVNDAEYSCIAINSVGQDRKNIRIHVNGKKYCIFVAWLVHVQ